MAPWSSPADHGKQPSGGTRTPWSAGSDAGEPVTRGARVELRGWGWRHPGRRAWALRGVDLVVEPGERVLLLGASGAGKSTLLAALAGLLDPSTGGEAEGRLLVDGQDARETRTATGLVLQDPDTGIVMGRAGDDVAFGLENRAVPPELIWARVDAALDAVGFPYGRDRPTDTLSGGEQQRLVIAGTLAAAPRLVLLDEPTANLDPGGATVVRSAIAALQAASAATTLLVEHRVDESLALVDRVVVLAAGGGVVADGMPDKVFAAQGPALAAAGVWVPGPPPLARADLAPAPAGGGALPATLLVASEVGTTHRGATSPALLPTSVDVRAGRALMVTGANGTGKTTLARVLGGLTAPSTGRVRAAAELAGPDADTPPHRWPAARLAGRVGSVFQDPEHQFLTGHVRDELALGPRRTGAAPAAVQAEVDRLLALTRLTALGAANPFTLSGGEKRRLSVAAALAAAPRVLVLDEPTFGQDRLTWAELARLLAQHRAGGGAVVAVTHDRALVEVLGDDELVLRTP